MDFSDLLPYLSAGGGCATPFLLWRLAFLEGQLKLHESEINKNKKSINLIYFWLSKSNTNFGNFISKHKSNI